MTKRRRSLLYAALGGIFLSAQTALGAFVLVDNFESYTTGNFNALGTTAEVDQGGPWQGRDSAGNIAGSGLIQVQNDGTTQHLAFGWGSGTRSAYRAVTPIADGDSATYYFQVRSLDDTPDQSYGLSDQAVATNAGFGDFEAQVALVDDGDGGNGQFKLIGRDGGSIVDLATGLVVNTWYDIWLVVDNLTDTYNVYMDTNSGDPDALGAPVGIGLGFRNGLASNPLVTFMTLDPNGNPSDVTAHLDDIYYNPVAVPEPTTLLLSLFAAFLVFRKRRCAR